MRKIHETMMTRISTPDPPPPPPHNIDSFCKSWKLYDNPYYCSSQSQHHHHKAFIWDLNFIRVFMESELDKARAEIKDLKAELDYERKARRRAESMNMKLAKDVEEVRMCREAEEMQYKRLLQELSFQKTEMVGMKQELEEERRMHKLAEVMREERVQMKLMNARLFLEEKLYELEGRQGEKKKERACSSPASRNPHIKRGIKGFVELPRMLKAIKSKGEQWGSKLECQKVQLKILLRQKSTPRSATLVSST